VRRLTTIAEVREVVAAARRQGRTVGLAPTLGALHEGHLANVRALAREVDVVVVSVFVNPTQFDRPEDLEAYPRTLDDDEAALEGLGPARPAFVFAPSPAEMYPRGPRTTVHVPGVTEVLEGASRPGHFDGVATVVTKLLSIVQPDMAVFGRKDAQQNVVIRHLVDDLDLPVRLLVTPTVREADGLALSSRNRRLTPEQRQAALAIPRALGAAVDAARRARDAGAPVTPSLLRDAALATLEGAPTVAVDYVEAVDPDTFAPPDGPRGEVADRQDGTAMDTGARRIVAIAADIGAVRLIDNVEVGDLDDEGRLLDAIG
jgi:pantoate--beta-alanine ligase